MTWPRHTPPSAFTSHNPPARQPLSNYHVKYFLETTNVVLNVLIPDKSPYGMWSQYHENVIILFVTLWLYRSEKLGNR